MTDGHPPRLYLVRHGIAEDAHPDAPDDDHRRRLTDRGRVRTERAAHGMRALGVQPMRMLTSPHVRATETAAILAAVLTPPAGVEVDAVFGFDGGVAGQIARATDLAGAFPLMIVGHQPMLGEVAGALVASGVLRQRLRKAGLIAIDLHPVGTRVVGELQMYVPPRVLRAVADSRG